MKRNYFILFLSIFCYVSFAQKKMVVFKSDGTFMRVDVAKIDSIIFEDVFDESHAVDLGLSVKWCDVNLGAKSSEQYGDYFAWGETRAKASYEIGTYNFSQGDFKSLTKYNNFDSYGVVDGLTRLDSIDDAAHVQLQEKWRIPTKEEYEELVNNCTWEWTTKNGIDGHLVTGPNGNSIFIPVAGYLTYDWDNAVGKLGNYWSSSLSTNNDPNEAYFLAMDKNRAWMSQGDRYIGRSIRPVYADSNIPSSDISQEEYFQDASEFDAYTYSIYKHLANFNFDNRHDTYGIPSIHMRLECRGMDMVSFATGYNWFMTELSYESRYDYSQSTYFIWSLFYNVIQRCNSLISTSEKSNLPQSEKNWYLATAFALRAYSYFSLAQIYQFTYYGNEDALCVPLRLDNEELLSDLPRATVKETYNQIIKDLKSSIALFNVGFTKHDSKALLNKDSATALLVRVLMVMHEYESAFSYSSSLLSLPGYTPYSNREVEMPSFISIDDKSWIWGLSYTEDSWSATTGIINWPSQLCSFAGDGYTGGAGVYKCINSKLYNQISHTDVRKGWWLDGECNSENLKGTLFYGFLTNHNALPYTNTKFAPANNDLNCSQYTQDYPMIRIEEMILAKAECAVQLGYTDVALNTLNTFVKNYRDPEYHFESTDKDELLNEIWFQRRIEFWGEGLSHYDIMRLRKDIDRKDSNFEEEFSFYIRKDNPVLLYRIPKEETQINSLIINNPEGKPTF